MADGAAPYLMPSGEEHKGMQSTCVVQQQSVKANPQKYGKLESPRVRVTETEQLKPTLLWCKKPYYSHVNL